MLHPSYTDLMEVVNSDVEPGEQPVVQSRYSIVMATSKRARQIVAGDEPLVDGNGKKPLSVAVDELYKSKIRVLTDDEFEAEQAKAEEMARKLEECREQKKQEVEDEENGDAESYGSQEDAGDTDEDGEDEETYDEDFEQVQEEKEAE